MLTCAYRHAWVLHNTNPFCYKEEVSSMCVRVCLKERGRKKSVCVFLTDSICAFSLLIEVAVNGLFDINSILQHGVTNKLLLNIYKSPDFTAQHNCTETIYGPSSVNS